MPTASGGPAPSEPTTPPKGLAPGRPAAREERTGKRQHDGRHAGARHGTEADSVRDPAGRRLRGGTRHHAAHAADLRFEPPANASAGDAHPCPHPPYPDNPDDRRGPPYPRPGKVALELRPTRIQNPCSGVVP